MPDVIVSERGEKSTLNIDKSPRSSCCTYHKSWKATVFSKAQETRKQHHGYLQSFWSRANKNLKVGAKSGSVDTNMDRKGKQHRDKIKTIPKPFPRCLHGASCFRAFSGYTPTLPSAPGILHGRSRSWCRLNSVSPASWQPSSCQTLQSPQEYI